jgi:type IV pilus assembly protein PilW
MTNDLNSGTSTQRGLTLIEIMIALVIGSVLIAGAGKIFISSKRNVEAQFNLQQIQENARYTLDLISRDLRRAGYFGGLKSITAIEGTSALLKPNGKCPPGNAWGRMLARPVFGLNDSNAKYACIPNREYLRGDIVVTRYAHPVTVRGALSDKQLYLRSNPSEGALFIGSKSGENRITEPSIVRKIVSHAYYIRASTTLCPDGSKPPALWRETLDGNGRPVAEELVTGVEQLQLQYGIADFNADDDIQSDQISYRYVDADHVTDSEWDASFDTASEWREWLELTSNSAVHSAVVLARVWLLVRAACAEPAVINHRTYAMGSHHYAVDDHFRRQLYSTTVQLRN